MATINKTSEEGFQNDVLTAPLPVLVDFTARWCMPCKQLDPVIQQLAAEWNGKLQVFKIDVDEHPGVASARMVEQIVLEPLGICCISK